MQVDNNKKKKKSSSGWTKVPVLNKLRLDNDSDADNLTINRGRFGKLDNQADADVDVDRSNRKADKVLRNLKSCLVKSSSYDTVQIQQHHVIENKCFSIAEDRKDDMKAVDRIDRGISKRTDDFSALHILGCRVILLISVLSGFLCIAYSERVAQYYMGPDTYPYMSATIRSMSRSQVYDSDRIEPTDSEAADDVNKIRKVNENIEKAKAETMRLRGCGDALFTAASTYNKTNEILKNRKCKFPALPAINVRQYKEDSAEYLEEKRRQIENAYFENYITQKDHYSNHTIYEGGDFLRSEISLPLDGSATISSSLVWNFNFNIFEDVTLIDRFKNDDINQRNVPVQIFLDVRVNERLLHFPGGNLIDIVLSKESNPVRMYLHCVHTIDLCSLPQLI